MALLLWLDHNTQAPRKDLTEDAAQRNVDARQREDDARDRERDARERERRVRERERDVQERERDVRERERHARERDEDMRERERAALAHAHNANSRGRMRKMRINKRHRQHTIQTVQETHHPCRLPSIQWQRNHPATLTRSENIKRTYPSLLGSPAFETFASMSL